MATPRRPRLPGLQVPANLAIELRLFLEALKERVEVASGDRGDPRLRLATLSDLEAAGLGTTIVQNGYATFRSNLSGDVAAATTSVAASSSGLDASSLQDVAAEELGDQHFIVVWDAATGAYRRLTYEEFADQFIRKWEDDEAYGELTIVAPDSDIDPRESRLLFEDDDGATTERMWDLVADAATFSLRLLDDAGENPVEAIDVVRTGLVVDTIDFKTINLYHNGVPIGGGVEVSDIAPTLSQGKLWWDTETGYLMVGYDDGDTTQWVSAMPAAPDVHDEVLTDGASNIIFAGGDVVMVIGVPNP